MKKCTIDIESRRIFQPITAAWALNDHDTVYYKKSIDISKLTVDEQADLIIKRLSTSPIVESPEEILMYRIAAEMSRAIDTEVMGELLNQTKKLFT